MLVSHGDHQKYSRISKMQCSAFRQQARDSKLNTEFATQQITHPKYLQKCQRNTGRFAVYQKTKNQSLIGTIHRTQLKTFVKRRKRRSVTLAKHHDDGISERDCGMRRNWHLIRQILLQVEQEKRVDQDTDLGCSKAETIHHINLIQEAGFAMPDGYGYVNWITNSGADFLDAARNDEIWNDVWGRCKARGIESLSADLLKECLKESAKIQLGL